jgi:hypothetical protein
MFCFCHSSPSPFQAKSSITAWRDESAMRIMKGYFRGCSNAAHKGRARLPKVLLPEPRKPMMRSRLSASSSSAWMSSGWKVAGGIGEVACEIDRRKAQEILAALQGGFERIEGFVKMLEWWCWIHPPSGLL